MPTGRKVQTLQGHTATVRALVFNRDSNRLVTAAGDGVVKVWETGHSQDLLTLEGHSEMVGSVAFSPEGRILATAGLDRQVRLWSR